MTTTATLPSFGWTKEQIVDWNEGAAEALRDYLISRAKGKAQAEPVAAVQPVAKAARAKPKAKPVSTEPKRKRGQRITHPTGYFIKGNVREATQYVEQVHKSGQARPVTGYIAQTYGVSTATARHIVRKFYGISHTFGAVECSARAEPRRQEARRHLKGCTHRPTVKEIAQQFHISRINAAELIRAQFGSARANQ